MLQHLAWLCSQAEEQPLICSSSQPSVNDFPKARGCTAACSLHCTQGWLQLGDVGPRGLGSLLLLPWLHGPGLCPPTSEGCSSARPSASLLLLEAPGMVPQLSLEVSHVPMALLCSCCYKEEHFH